MTTAIKTENLSKIYRLGEIGTGTISRDLERWWARMRGKEDPFLKIGQANDRAVKGDSDIVYSLRDINFEIQQGEAVGIIGKNGAGKSTLLKILSRVTSPTTGKIDIKGRIASLLEVGTGFHPELTGRENIYLNGAILGMRKKEITRKLDEIIDFSGVERYIDTPVKRYSSGMYVRLAFAVAAHLESEILIVDEVLAVGDAEFQKKCLGKMGYVSKNDGRTILFVSHNMAAVQKLCQTSILLTNGNIKSHGEVSKIIAEYISQSNDSGLVWNKSHPENNYLVIESVILNQGKSELININSEIIFSINVEFLVDVSGISFELFLSTLDDLVISCTFSESRNYSKGKQQIKCIFPSHLLNDITYLVTLAVAKNYLTFIVQIPNIIKFEANNETENNFLGKIPGIIRPNCKWLTI